MADDGPLDASDKRVRWLAEKVSAGLGCDVDLFASCVANDDETRDRVEAFVRGALLRPRLSRRIPPQRHPRRARVGAIHGSRGLLTSFPHPPPNRHVGERGAPGVRRARARGDAPAGTRSTPFEQSSSGNENAEATVDAPEDGGGEPEQNGERATEAVDASSRAPENPRDDVAAFAEGDGPEPSPGDDRGPNAEGASRMDGTCETTKTRLVAKTTGHRRRELAASSGNRASRFRINRRARPPRFASPRARSRRGVGRRRRTLHQGFAGGGSAPRRRHGGPRALRRARELPGPSLDALEQLIKQVFVPLLGANGDGADAEGGGARRGGKRRRRGRRARTPVLAAAEGERDAQRRRRRAKKSASALSAAPFRATVLSPRSRPSSRATRGSSASACAARRDGWRATSRSPSPI